MLSKYFFLPLQQLANIKNYPKNRKICNNEMLREFNLKYPVKTRRPLPPYLFDKKGLKVLKLRFIIFYLFNSKH